MKEAARDTDIQTVKTTDERYLRVIQQFSSGALARDVAANLGISVGRANQLRHAAIRRGSRVLKIPPYLLAYLAYPRQRNQRRRENYARYSCGGVSLPAIIELDRWIDEAERVRCAQEENDFSDPLDDIRAFQCGLLPSHEFEAIWSELSSRMRNEENAAKLLHGAIWIERNEPGSDFPCVFGEREPYDVYLKKLKRQRERWSKICAAIEGSRYGIRTA